MIIIIPLGGVGERFKKQGYVMPKALIEIDDKPIIFNLLDNLKISNNIKFVYIPYNKEYLIYNLEKIISERYPTINFKFFLLENNTNGAADTIRIALNNVNIIDDCPILSIDCDNFYTTDIINIWNGENKVFTFSDTLDVPIFSYVTTITNSVIIENIVEKKKISDNACCGAYGFESWIQLLQYTTLINEISKEECYTSLVVKEMINQKLEFKNENIQNKYYYSLGTPEQIKNYEYSFLFDLDGTLVNTDHIYIDVWNIIFKKYNIDIIIDTTFFNNFIKGKNDGLFLTYLLPNISSTTLSEISYLKDELFIELLKTKKEQILLPGVIKFFEKNKNRKIAIVTSCNRKSAEFITEYTGLNNYISLLIASEDCKQHKPDPEPYLNAITLLNIKKNRTIIFEDSFSGYTSAKNAKVYKIILICNESSCQDIMNTNEYKINDYNNLNVNDVIQINLETDNIPSLIKQLLKNTMPIKSIESNNIIQMKTGYICDIKSYKIIYNSGITENIVLKINNIDNSLSKIAEQLELYNNEIFFYSNIRNLISDIIYVPNCYGVVSIDDTRKGIILENLFKYDGVFNIDLNKNTQTLLNVVSEISKLHIKYYFKTNEELPLIMTNVCTMNNTVFYKNLISERFENFMIKNILCLNESEKKIMYECFQNFEQNIIHTSSFPLSFCHGDFKSPNIFYKYNNDSNRNIIYLLDWQYINLNKGVSDIVFLLVESIKFNKNKVDMILNYYYSLINEKIEDYTYDDYIRDFKTSLCAFPFFVCVWFNSEDADKLLDKIFPIKFMKNLLEYYKYFL